MEKYSNIQNFFNRQHFTIGELKQIWAKSIENETIEEQSQIKIIFKKGLSKFVRYKKTFRSKTDFIERNKIFVNQKTNQTINLLRNYTLHEILNSLELNTIQFSGIALKYNIDISNLNVILTDEQFIRISDFLLSRLNALERNKIIKSRTTSENKYKIKQPKKNNIKPKKKIKQKTSLADIIMQRGGIGKVIYTKM